jgi:hypothetical protein
MKYIIKVLLLSGIYFYSLCSDGFGQDRVNELSLGIAQVYFPDWNSVIMHGVQGVNISVP